MSNSKIRANEDRTEPRSPALPKPANFEFRREDWVPFRTVEGLQQKAGVSRYMLRRLVLKELADNGLDACDNASVGRLPDGSYYVRDEGPGIDGTPKEIAERFSISRAMVSSKLFRLPTRGALGNGLRVVAGAVLASGGSLTVITRNRKIELRPETDGTTTVVSVENVDHPIGVEIRIAFGPAIPHDSSALSWAQEACEMAKAAVSAYDGKTSPFWYDAAQFHELFLASGARPVRELVAELEGCSGAKAGSIVKDAGLARTVCSDVDRPQAYRLLNAARALAREVKPGRLGLVGEAAFPDHYHVVVRGVVPVGGSTPRADVPFVVEAWATQDDDLNDVATKVAVNRTPVIATLDSYRSSGSKTDLSLHGCGLSHLSPGIPTKGGYDVRVNITTPFCSIISDGKAPDLGPFAQAIGEAIVLAIKKAKRAAPKERKISQKDVILDNLDDAIAKASGDGEYQFNERQVYYVLRDAVMQETGVELKIKNFSEVITDYESEHGPIPGMYREPRGSLMHPHSDGEQIALGDLMVRNYERPAWTFNKILYIEKEGFTQALSAAEWPERHDCALMSSKGFTTRAVRDLVDKMAEHDEPILVFCVHDADASGSMIYQTFQEATKARGARKIRIVNLGLEPWEAIAMGLAPEELGEKERNKPVAGYITEDAPDDGKDWKMWLQTNRVELNAMTMPQMIAWLDAKMAEHGNGKLIPPEDVLLDAVNEQIEDRIRDAVRERVLRENNFEGQVAAALLQVADIAPSGRELITGLQRMFDAKPERPWRDHIDDVAYESTWSQID